MCIVNLKFIIDSDFVTMHFRVITFVCVSCKKALHITNEEGVLSYFLLQVL